MAVKGSPHQLHDQSRADEGPQWYRPPGGGLLPACDQCQAHLVKHGPAISYACASAGIERGRSTFGMLVHYIGYYHRNGHPQLLPQ